MSFLGVRIRVGELAWVEQEELSVIPRYLHGFLAPSGLPHPALMVFWLSLVLSVTQMKLGLSNNHVVIHTSSHWILSKGD